MTKFERCWMIKHFWWKFFLMSKIFYWQNFLLTKTSFDQNIFTKKVFNPKIFLPKIFVYKKCLLANIYFPQKVFDQNFFLTKIFSTIKRDPRVNFIILWAASATFESAFLLDVTLKNRTSWDWVVPSSVKADSNWKSCKKEN